MLQFNKQRNFDILKTKLSDRASSVAIIGLSFYIKSLKNSIKFTAKHFGFASANAPLHPFGYATEHTESESQKIIYLDCFN